MIKLQEPGELKLTVEEAKLVVLFRRTDKDAQQALMRFMISMAAETKPRTPSLRLAAGGAA